MYDDKIKEAIISDLGNKTMEVANTAIVLVSQGYLINKNKYIKLDWSSILIHAFENIDILSDEQKLKVEQLYNKIVAL